MRVFLDTEFTDFIDPKLISCGLIAQDGQTFYAEMSDVWQTEHCSEFVLNEVLPRLDRVQASTLCHHEAGESLTQWLAALDNQVVLIHDAAVDWQLLDQLLAPAPHHGVRIDPQILVWPGSAMARHYELLLAQAQSDDTKRHHALFDAQIMRHAVLQTESDFR